MVVGANGCTVLAVASSSMTLAGARAMLRPPLPLLLLRLLQPLEQQRAASAVMASTATGAARSQPGRCEMAVCVFLPHSAIFVDSTSTRVASQSHSHHANHDGG